VRIGITGISGFVGTRLSEAAKAAGHDVVGFSRSGGNGLRSFSTSSACDCTGLDAIVHLAGESILGYWNQSKMQKIRDSRIFGTRQVVEGISFANPPPAVLVCASAIGYYGETGDAIATEESSPGTNFLAEVTTAWEAEAVRAEGLGIRVVRLRIGFVLGKGGAMKMVIPIFKSGLGSKLGNGRQYMSPIHVDDVAGMALWAIQNEDVEGPVNAVIPEAVRNSEFTAELAAQLNRPAFLPAPAFMLRLALRQLSGVMLDSCRVQPATALYHGYKFLHPDLPAAIKASI